MFFVLAVEWGQNFPKVGVTPVFTWKWVGLKVN